MSLCSVVIGGASPRQVRIQLPRGGASRDLKCGFLFPPDYSIHSSLALEKRLRSQLQELLELATLRASRLYPNFVFNFHNHFPVDSILGNTSSFRNIYQITADAEDAGSHLRPPVTQLSCSLSSVGVPQVSTMMFNGMPVPTTPAGLVLKEENRMGAWLNNLATTE